jgi:RNA polymerase sigma-70 factor (ECF subfamily)
MKKHNYETDEEIVEKVRRSNNELYAEIIKRYQTKLIRYAEYFTKNKQIAEDVVQESFIKAYIDLNGFNTKKKFSSWIYRIVHNIALNELKKRNRQKQIIHEEHKDEKIHIEDEYIKKELQKKTYMCLEQMPFMYSEPLTLYFLEEKSYDEISDILRISAGTVATRINRAKAIMKKICEKNHL